MRWILRILLHGEWRRHTVELHDSTDCVFCHMSLECQNHWSEDNYNRVVMKGIDQ